jgi:hypothetical protein
MGTVEGMQNVLAAVGVVFDPADWINASIYARQGDLKNAAIYGSGVGIAAGLKVGGGFFSKMLNKIKTDAWDKVKTISGSRTINTTEEAFKVLDELGFETVDQFEDWMILKSETDEAFQKFLGTDQVKYFEWLKNWKTSMKANVEALAARGEQYREVLTPENMKLKDILKAEDPVQALKEAIEAGNKNIPTPPDYSKISPLQKKLDALRDNPNIGGHLDAMMKENVKKYNK